MKKGQEGLGKKVPALESDQSENAYFSDEKTITIQNNKGSSYVRQRLHTVFNPSYLLPTIKHPTIVMNWECMSSKIIEKLHICVRMMNVTK